MPSGHVESLTWDHLPALRELLDDPAVHCFAEARIFPPRGPVGDSARPTVLGYLRDARLISAVMLGANLVPVRTDPQSREALAHALIRMGRRSSSIVGPRQEVLPLWELLEPAWGPARQVRADQPLLALDRRADIPADPAVHPVREALLEQYLPSSIAMFMEEVGVDPRAGGLDELYRQRVGELLAQGRAFARWQDGSVVFKAELGAVTKRAVQVQGVWVDPRWRGRGLSEPGMAAVVGHGLAVAPLVTLYVNRYNTAALAAYQAVGFRQVETFATVLL